MNIKCLGQKKEKLRTKKFFVNLHYMPLHLNHFFKKKGFKLGQFPVSENYGKNSISIPIFFDLKQKKIIEIYRLIKSFY